MARELDYNQFVFGRNEVPPHTKFNNVLYLMELQRRLFGPYTFDITATTASSITVDLYAEAGDNGEHIGYWWQSGGDYYLTRKFGAEYRNDADNIYVRWENMEFKWDASTAWLGEFDREHVVYATDGGTTKYGEILGDGAGELDISGSTNAQLLVFSMIKQSG